MLQGCRGFLLRPDLRGFCLPYSGNICWLVSSEGGWVVDSSFCGAGVLLSIVGVGRSLVETRIGIFTDAVAMT